MKYFLNLVTYIPYSAMSLQKSDNYASDKGPGNTENIDEWQWEVDRFADIKVLRYKVPGWENLPLKDKKLAYYLIEAGRAGFDIIWDQNYKHNLTIRKALLAIWKCHSIDRTKPEWNHLETYIKQVFFSNGIHHHYSHDKFIPLFSKEYFKLCLQQSNVQLTEGMLDAIFDPKLDAKKVEQNEEVDVIQNSCVNFYGPGITRDEVTAFYEKVIDPNDPTPIAHGLNSKLSKVNGKLIEERYHLNGLYGSAISKIIENLTEAQKYAEPNMANGLTLLIEYFTTGDLKKWDEYCIHWVSEGSEGANLVDYILGFIEVYNDPLEDVEKVRYC